MPSITWIMGFLCLYLVYLVNRRSSHLEDRADSLTREYYGLSSLVSQMSRDLESELPRLSVEIKRRTGNLRFEEKTTIREAHFIHPQAEELLGIGASGGCGSSQGRVASLDRLTIREFSAHQDIDLDSVLQQLNGLLDGTTKVLQSHQAFVPITAIRKNIS